MRAEFVVLTTQRSGSTWFVDMLDSHPEVKAFSELFLDGGAGRRMAGAQDCPFFDEFRAEQPTSGRDPRRLLDAYLDEVFRTRPGVTAAGFKLMYGQLGAHEDLGPALKARGARYLHLVRDNLLDVLISKHTAVKRDLFHLKGAAAAPEVTIRLNPHTLSRELKVHADAIERARRSLAPFGSQVLEVEYERLAANPAAFLPVLDFLEVRGDPALASPLRKINPRDQAAVVENFDEVRAALAGGAYERFLR